ncbi:Mss4-like protein [Gongronella butleri]|nr:Mss4-like protein [Gongronella butleri]
MLLYSDIISGDEMFSDAYEVDDVIVEVDCQMITVGGDDIQLEGSNPSAEGGDEGAESTAETVNNVVHSFRLTATAFDKKSYLTYLKGYMKAIKAKLQEENPERVPIFEAKAQVQAKKIIGNFKDYEFYVGESMDPDGMVALLNYREDGVTPYFTFFKDGLKQIKL